jgi:hypothetical protein
MGGPGCADNAEEVRESTRLLDTVSLIRGRVRVRCSARLLDTVSLIRGRVRVRCSTRLLDTVSLIRGRVRVRCSTRLLDTVSLESIPAAAIQASHRYLTNYSTYVHTSLSPLLLPHPSLPLPPSLSMSTYGNNH